MSWTLIQSSLSPDWTTQPNSTTLVWSLPQAVSTNSLVVGELTTTSNISSVTLTDDKGNTYNLTASADDTTGGQLTWGFWLANVNNGPRTFTATFDVATWWTRIGINEFSPALSTGTADGDSAQYTSTNLATQFSGNITTSVSGDLIYGYGVNAFQPGITLSQGTSFQRLNNGLSTDSINVLDEFYVQPSAGSINSSIGLSPASTAVVGVMAFKPLPIVAPSTSSQNVVAAIPVNAIDPPPEGQRAAKINVSLTPISFYNANQFQLNSQSGLTLSQVCTLVIDNSQNSSPITVVHGALSQQVLVPQNTTTIVPTFSTKGYYFLSVGAIIAPTQTLNIPITLLNYVRQGGQFSAQQNVNVQNAGAIDITVGGPTPITIQNTILNTGHNSTVLVSSIAQLTPGAPTTTFGTAALKAWLLDSLDF